MDPARAAEFEEAILRGASTVIAHAKGFRGYKVNRSMESPGRYILMIYWDTLEDHTIGFRGSDAFAQWRAIVGPFFAQPPVVEHLELVGKS
ncbi:MAG: antibiotic biosynthesis monooxygenase [Hydrogenophaga sp.]|nr:antibiotic biosynthesis monooxygenase [Hydrogenophaga sp.]